MCKAEIWTQCGAYECFVQTKFGGAWLREQNFTGQKWAESGRF